MQMAAIIHYSYNPSFRLERKYDVCLPLLFVHVFLPNILINYAVHVAKTVIHHVGFEVPTAVDMKSTVFWDITLRSPLNQL
jgi:hypothetical protein